MANLSKRSASAAEAQVELAESKPINGGVGERRPSAKTSGLPGLLTRFTSRAWEQDADIERRRSSSAEAGKWLPFLALTFSGIGVVYGDIGTSFIYVFPAVFAETPSEEDIIGAVSLVIWTITTLCLVKYALLVLRADDNGQGGAFALFSLLKRQAELGRGSRSLNRSLSQYSAHHRKSATGRQASEAVAPDTYKQRFIESPWTQKALTVLVCVGVGAIMGDGVLTPSVSVVSACEGINVRWPDVSRGVIDGIAIAIIVVLFGVQRYGTGTVGLLFSPIVTLWLLSNAVIGVYNIAVHHPGIFVAFSPEKWFSYFLRGGTASWRSLGGVLLCVTGCEALFADLGHFSRRSIQCSFLFVCWPCLILTYLGQAAYLIQHPGDFSTSFWSSLPNGTFFPLFILATLASIIASQALISAAFQIVKQAIAQGFFPRFTVIHTSQKHKGQVYIPFICYLLGGLCVIIIATFQTSTRLTRAYGLAVLFDMLITTHFFTMVLLCVWQVPVILPIAFYLVFATLEATFLSATAEKIPTGGWFSLMMSAIYTAIMLLWFWGSRHKNRYFSNHATNLSKLLQVKGGGKDEPSITVMGQTPCSRLPGAALWYTDVLKGAPPTLERHLTRFPALHAINVVFTVRFVPVPSVYDDERFLVKSLPIPGFYHVIARYGYGERISQDETFADMILQRISMLQYNTLHAMVTTSPQLQGMLPNLSSNFDDSAKPEHGTPPILEHESLYVASQPLVPRLSAPTSVFEPEDFTAIQITGDAGTAMERRSAPVGSIAEAYPAGKPRSSAHLHGFTDASFQPAFRPEAEGTLDATSAATLAQWAAKVADGAIVLPSGNEAVEDLARDIAAVTEAKEHGVTFVVGSTQARASEKAKIFKKYLVHEPFLFLVHNFTSNADLAFGIPLDKLAIVGLPYHLD